MKGKRIALIIISILNAACFYLVLYMPYSKNVFVLLWPYFLFISVSSIALIVLSCSYADATFRSPKLWGILAFLCPCIAPIVLAVLKERTWYPPSETDLDKSSENRDSEVQNHIKNQERETIKTVKKQMEAGIRDAKKAVDTPASSQRKLTSDHSTSIPIISPTEEAELRDMVSEGRKLQAIKRVRELTGWGLKETEEYLTSFLNDILSSFFEKKETELRGLSKNQKSEAIKQIRQLLGCELKEAHNYLKELMSDQKNSGAVYDNMRSLLYPKWQARLRNLLIHHKKQEGYDLVKQITGWHFNAISDYVDQLKAGAILRSLDRPFGKKYPKQ